MTRAFLVVLLLAACGGPRAPTGPQPPPDAGDDLPPWPSAAGDAGAADPCGAYVVAVAPILGRIDAAATVFADTLARAQRAEDVENGATALADAIERERPALEAIHTGDPALDAAHAQLVTALAQMADAVRGLGAVVRGGDQLAKNTAATRLDRAVDAWLGAVDAVRARCPAMD